MQLPAAISATLFFFRVAAVYLSSLFFVTSTCISSFFNLCYARVKKSGRKCASYISSTSLDLVIDRFTANLRIWTGG